LSTSLATIELYFQFGDIFQAFVLSIVTAITSISFTELFGHKESAKVLYFFTCSAKIGINSSTFLGCVLHSAQIQSSDIFWVELTLTVSSFLLPLHL
jgi:uncharacterized membrane protein